MSLQSYAAATATDWDRRSGGTGWLVAPGSLLKIDLSGFTRLSERLARSELTGAERLNAVLTDVFTGLIDEVRVYNRALPQADVQTDMNTPIDWSGVPTVLP